MKKINRPLQYVSFALLLFGIKLWVIGTYGNATPFWDQWDAEAANLYMPYLDHTLTWSHWFYPHNEHRIFTTRVLALLELQLNGVWNPLLQMVVNAGLHILAIVLGIYLVKKTMDRPNLPALLTFSFILFAIPFGWENTLAGFQAQFYFVILFGILSLWLLVTEEPLGARWWGGIACGVLAFLSLASGVFALAAALCLHLLFYVTGIRRNIKQAIGTAIILGLFIGEFLLTPALPGSVALKAHSFSEFFDSFVGILGWPVDHTFLASCFVNLPILIFCIRMLIKRPPARDGRWFIFAIAVWAIAQVASIAYGRTHFNMSSRYRDLFAMFLFANFACLLSMAAEYTTGKWRNRLVIGSWGWTAVILISLGIFSAHALPVELNWKKKVSDMEEGYTKGYVATHDMSYLKDKPGSMDIPYPDADALAKIIDAPGIKEILPANLGAPLLPVAVNVRPEGSFVPGGFYFTTPKWDGNTWGSWTHAQGDSSRGEMTWTFHSNFSHRELVVPIAGYPLRDGIKLELVQNGETRKVHIGEDPHETWKMGYVPVAKGDFSLHLVDTSKTTWLAVGGPTLMGRLDPIADSMLSHYWFFLMLGALLLLFTFINQNKE